MDLQQLLQSRFGYDSFRPGQHAICEAIAQGQDALVVMPTGAGKSLCYQLPGLARGGTTRARGCHELRRIARETGAP